ncbi:MAG: hypothetical protein E7029_11625 [Planctomycetaceae bacterium]|nr:hypothetical protein [Planctomycetaceae bacterium]
MNEEKMFSPKEGIPPEAQYFGDTPTLLADSEPRPMPPRAVQDSLHSPRLPHSPCDPEAPLENIENEVFGTVHVHEQYSQEYYERDFDPNPRIYEDGEEPFFRHAGS